MEGDLVTELRTVTKQLGGIIRKMEPNTEAEWKAHDTATSAHKALRGIDFSELTQGRMDLEGAATDPEKTCPNCQGRGTFDGIPCKTCGGVGKVKADGSQIGAATAPPEAPAKNIRIHEFTGFDHSFNDAEPLPVGVYAEYWNGQMATDAGEEKQVILSALGRGADAAGAVLSLLHNLGVIPATALTAREASDALTAAQYPDTLALAYLFHVLNFNDFVLTPAVIEHYKKQAAETAPLTEKDMCLMCTWVGNVPCDKQAKVTRDANNRVTYCDGYSPMTPPASAPDEKPKKRGPGRPRKNTTPDAAAE